MSAHAILIVDDNENNRVALSMRLDLLGHSDIILAAHGREALEKMRTRRLDLVLLDIMMPEMDGYEVLEAMKRDPDLRDTPVIMISAVEETASVIRCLELGADDYLTKPFNPTILQARINAALERVRHRKQELVYFERIEAEKRRADELLGTLLPKSIARLLKTGKRLEPRRYEDVAILVCDIAGFTPYSERNPPEEVFGNLESLLNEFERVAQHHGLEKIKTVGDAFLAAAGLLMPHDDPVFAAVECAVEMVRVAGAPGRDWQVRIGIDHGPVVAGIIGKTQVQFDIWGDAVNTAFRIQQQAAPNAVQLSGRAWPHVRGRVRGRSLGLVALKGKDQIEIIETVGAA